MMRIIFLTLMLITILPVTAYAIPDDGNGQAAGASCSWDQFTEQLGCQETGFVCGGGACPKSCDKQYVTISPRADDPSWGKWQFTPATWRRYTGTQYPQCQGMSASLSVECRPAQKWATERMMEDAVKWLEGKSWCGAKLGQPITGTHQGTTKSCVVNKSGLLSAYHNAGTNACAFAAGQSKWSSQINWRICDAQNIPFPENCTPSDTPPVVPDTVTPGTPYVAPAGEGFEHLGEFNALGQSLKYIWVAAFQKMTSQLSTFMMQQVEIIGTFFDAKHQLETQRLMQEKAAQAHKDYQPSEQMCEIGTFVRDLISSERRADLTQSALSQSMMDRALATGDSKTSQSSYDDATKTHALLDKFCRKSDNAGQNEALCEGVTYDPAQINADINFTQSIDAPLTLDINLTDNVVKPDEENIFAFLDYIFMQEKFPWISASNTTLFSFVKPYQDMRSIIAMRSVAQNSFAKIIAQKTAGSDGAGESAAPFIKALMREMGMEDADIEATIGENPSYYAQMEMLTKRIYQHPEFISNLYDKPANVKRIRAAMTAIKLMQDRDIHDALMRREMLMSILLELQLREKQENILNKSVNPAITGETGEPDTSFGGGTTTGGGAGGTF